MEAKKRIGTKAPKIDVYERPHLVLEKVVRSIISLCHSALHKATSVCAENRTL